MLTLERADRLPVGCECLEAGRLVMMKGANAGTVLVGHDGGEDGELLCRVMRHAI